MRRSRIAWRVRLQPSFTIASSVCRLNTALGQAQKLLWKTRVADAAVRCDPIIVIGHWRSGTTLLHELLSLHPDVTFPNNYCCFAPHHFLITERNFGREFDFLAPPTRPMDAAKLVWDAPQEDEFATCGLGADSVYWRFGFPGKRLIPLHQFDYGDKSRSWELAFVHFMRMLTVRSEKRLVLKSPTHSFRVLALSNLFPRVRFVFMVRDPAATVASFAHMLREIVAFAGFERTRLPTARILAEGMLALTNAAKSAAASLPAQIIGVPYDQLRRKPIEFTENLADSLGLEASNEFTRRLQRYTELNQIETSLEGSREAIPGNVLPMLDEIRECQLENWLEAVSNV